MNSKIAFIKSNHKARVLKVLKHSEIKEELTDQQKVRIQNRIDERKKIADQKLKKEIEKAFVET